MFNHQLAEVLHVVNAIPPVNITAGASGLWVNLHHWRRCLVLLAQGAWASGTPAITLQQATDNGGTGAKTLSIDRYWQTAPSDQTHDTITLTTAASNTFNLPNTANTVTLLEVHSNDLDIANSFDHFQCVIGAPSATDLFCMLYVLSDPAFAVSSANQPSAVA